MRKIDAGFTNPQQIGLFTFYREQNIQETAQKIPGPPEQSKYHSERSRRVPLPPLNKPQLSFVALSPHSIIINEAQKARPYHTPIVRPTLALDQDLGSNRYEAKSMVHYSFELTVGPKEKERHRLLQKTRAKTEAATLPLQSYTSPLKHSPLHERVPKDSSVEYFSIKTEPTRKMKIILQNSSHFKKIVQKNDKQLCHYSHHLISIASQEVESGTKSKLPLPKIHQGGPSISFWHYFQQRKNQLLGKYKKKRGSQKSPPLITYRRLKPTLINNHI